MQVLVLEELHLASWLCYDIVICVLLLLQSVGRRPVSRSYGKVLILFINIIIIVIFYSVIGHRCVT